MNIIAGKDVTYAVAKKKAWKNSGLLGFKPLTFVIPVQRSTKWANKPTGL